MAALASDVAAAGIAAGLADAAEHVAQAMPELVALMKGGDRFEQRFRPYVNEIAHCLASALEAVLIASRDAAQVGIGAPRREGEETLLIVARDYLDRVAG